MDDFIKKFKDWNNALIENLIPDNQPFILFVNDNIINEIGKNKNLGNADDFHSIMSELKVKEFRQKVFYKLYGIEIGTFDKGRYYQSSHLFDFANWVGDKFSAKYYISFIVWALLIASKAQNGIGQALTSELNEGENTPYSGITALFEKLKKDFPQFNNSRSTNHRHVGLLRFQLILSPWQEKSILKALKKIGYNPLFAWDNYEICSQIYDHVDSNINNIINLSLSGNNEAIIIAERLKNIFVNFDPEEFNLDDEENNSNESEKKITKRLSFAIGIPNYNSDNIAKLNLYTNVSECIKEELFFLEEGSLNCNGNNQNPVELNEPIKLKKYELESQKYTFKTFDTDDVVIFYRVHDYLYMQHPEFKQTGALVLVKNDKRVAKKFDKWREGQNFSRLIDFKIEGIETNEWIAYITDMLQSQYYKSQNPRERINVNNSLQNIIFWHNKKNRYPINQLPYFSLPNNATKDNTSLYINLDGKTSENFTFVISDNKLFLLSLDYETDFSNDHKIDFTIEIKDSQKKVSLNDCFKVYEPLIKQVDQPFKYDRFGKFVTDDQEEVNEENFIRGIYVDGNKSIEIPGPLNTNCKEYDREEFFRRSKFVNLIASKCFEQENGDISTNTFDGILDYFLNCHPEVSNINEKLIKHKLINTGVVSFNPQKQRIQAIPPILLRIPQAFNIYNKEKSQYTCPDGLYCYILVGCYTRQFLLDLEQLVEDNNGVMYVKDNGYQDDICPPTLIIRISPTVTHNAMCNDDILLNTFILAGNSNKEFSEGLNFEKREEDYFLEHLSKKDAFDNKKDISKTFPRIRKDKNPKYCQNFYIEQDNNQFCKIDYYQLPWASIYCKEKKEQPIIIYNKDTKEVYIPYQNVKLPFFIQRALYIMNGGYPKFKDCFICDHKSEEEIYYTIMRKYNAWNNENINAIIAMLSNGTNTSFIREIKNTRNYEIQYWKNKAKHKNDSYCVLKENDGNEIIAYEHKGNVYYKDNDVYRILRGNFKEIFTFLLFNAVQKNNNSLGISRNYTFESKYELGEEALIIPSPNDYTKTILEII